MDTEQRPAKSGESRKRPSRPRRDRRLLLRAARLLDVEVAEQQRGADDRDREAAWRVEQEVVWAHTRVTGDLASFGVAAMTSVPALESTRLASARFLDEKNQHRILVGLDGCRVKEQAYPAGVAGAAVATTIGRGIGVLYQVRALARGPISRAFARRARR